MTNSKTLFQRSQTFKGGDYAKLLENPSFEIACGAALATFVESLPGSAADPSKAWDSYLQILGARAVLDHLSRLHEPDEKNVVAKFPNLNYQTDRSKLKP